MNKQTQYWLMKSEPSEFSIDDLNQAGEVVWDGVRNYQVRNMFRYEMRAGDRALFYHSSCKEVGVVGEMEIIKPAEVDPTQFVVTSKYYDSKSTKEAPRWFGPRVRFVTKYPRLVALSELKSDGRFKDMTLLRPGNRLSAFPIKAEYYKLIKRLAEV